MTSTPHTITTRQTLAEAHQAMREQGVRHLPVVEDGKLVGVVSQRDLYLLETLRGVDVGRELVEEAMSDEPFVVGPDAPLEEVAEVMANRKHGSALVVEHSTVVGIFTSTDALRALVTPPAARRSRDRRGRRRTLTRNGCVRRRRGATDPARVLGNSGTSGSARHVKRNVSRHVVRENVQLMSRIESEARSLLLNRRDALRRTHDPSGADGYAGEDLIPEGLIADKIARELAEVDAALGRIAQGSYGTCISCGGPLGLQRLRAIPEARFCLGCSGHRPGDD